MLFALLALLPALAPLIAAKTYTNSCKPLKKESQPLVSDCLNLLDTLPADTTPRTFASDNDLVANTWLLPYAKANGTCQMTLDLDQNGNVGGDGAQPGGGVNATWVDIQIASLRMMTECEYMIGTGRHVDGEAKVGTPEGLVVKISNE